MADWNAAQYQKFEEERTRPALDLLAHVPIDDPGAVIDLGCGSGILSVAALKLGAAHALGVDIDEEADWQMAEMLLLLQQGK